MEKALAASLAKSLGIDESKVTAALDELRTAEQADHAAALKPRLDQAVKDGTLTQAEADAVTKAAEKGVIGGAPLANARTQPNEEVPGRFPGTSSA